jgi:hypothetical protein
MGIYAPTRAYRIDERADDRIWLWIGDQSASMFWRAGSEEAVRASAQALVRLAAFGGWSHWPDLGDGRLPEHSGVMVQRARP